MLPTNKQPLFIISGASGVGKSTLCEQLFQKEKDYIVPEQIECQPERTLFTQIHYLAAVCNEEVLLHRMRDMRKIEDEVWLKSSLDFNQWLKMNGESTQPEMTLLDITHLTPQQAAKQVDQWIHKRLEKRKI